MPSATWGLRALVRLKANVPSLYAAARARFEETAPTAIFDECGARVEVWDAADFDPWEDLRWATVRVIGYRQHHRDGTRVEAYCFTDLSPRRVSTRALYRVARGRWTIENQGFNDSKSRDGLDHVPHQEATSLLIRWLLVMLTLSLRYLRRGTHRPVSAITLVRRLRLSLGQSVLEAG